MAKTDYIMAGGDYETADELFPTDREAVLDKYFPQTGVVTVSPPVPGVDPVPYPYLTPGTPAGPVNPITGAPDNLGMGTANAPEGPWYSLSDAGPSTPTPGQPAGTQLADTSSAQPPGAASAQTDTPVTVTMADPPASPDPSVMDTSGATIGT